MSRHAGRALKQVFDSVIEEQAKFERAARVIWITYLALFIGLFVVIWLRT